MDHPARVRIRQCARHLLQNARALLGPKGPELANALPQRVALDVGHGEEHELFDLVHGEDGHDVGVREPRRRPRFVQEALAGYGVQTFGGREQLDGDLAVEAQLTCEVYDPHASTPQAALEDVPAGQGVLQLWKRSSRIVHDRPR